MTKIVLTDLANLQNETTAVNAINSNNAVLEAAFDNTLSRDGTSPNTMNAPLDMNAKQILNLPAPSTVNSPARLIDVTSNPTIVIPGTGTSGHVVGYLDTNNTTSGNNIHSGTETFNGAATFNAGITFSSDIANSGLAPMAANTVKANLTGGSAKPTDVTTASLKTALAVVETIAGNTGAFTLTNGLTNSTNAIGLVASRLQTPTIQRFLSGSGTYTTPANCLWIRIRMIGGGGGGGQTAAGSGTSSTFSTLTAGGGTGGSGSTFGGVGGSASGGNVLNLLGGVGGSGGGTLVANIQGAMGGSGYFGGAGSGTNAAVIASSPNTGAGGSGSANTGTGGGSGGYVEHIIGSPAASYAYTVGAGGSNAGGGSAGATGVIIVEEYYN